VRGINYHAVSAASTAIHRLVPGSSACCACPLTWCVSMPILGFPPTTKGGDPVFYTKRCHLAGIARQAV
jgi:streptolysin S family bacteriocin protoxin